VTTETSDSASRAAGSSPRRVWISALVAVAAVALLVTVLRWEREGSTNRWTTLITGSPKRGAELFKASGCGGCHTPAGDRETPGPDLAAETSSRSGPDQLVTVMWNHAPRMWQLMQEAKVAQPKFSQREMADLLAYLYTLRYTGESGDAGRGEVLFASKGCSSCHAVRGQGGRAAKDLTALGATLTPTGWATAMWNHPRTPADRERPGFDGGEMSDILSYLRGGTAATSVDPQLLNASFERGWRVFRDKSCVACHSVKDEAGHVGPELGPGRQLPTTVLALSASMWNHSPAMWSAMEHLRIERVRFRQQEMADLVAFLFSFHYVEPGGSPKVGEVLFAGRGCSRCHGPRALGTPQAPALRGRGTNFNSVTIATALWRHGPDMYKRATELGLTWPVLGENDVGDLIAFLNTSPEEKR
jgi:mono/diheme cytochrome c family protein